METLRCPTCLILLLLLDGGEQRCPVCRSQFRTPTRPTVLGDGIGTSARQPLLAEREPQARVEEEITAQRRQRRGAARAARRAAALSPALLRDAIVEATQELWALQPAQATPTISDLPAEAIRVVTLTSVTETRPEPVPEPATSAPKGRRRRRAARMLRHDESVSPFPFFEVDSEDVITEPATTAPESTSFQPTITEPVEPAASSDEAAPVDLIVELAAEPVVGRALYAWGRRPRRRAVTDTRPDDTRAPSEVKPGAGSATGTTEVGTEPAHVDEVIDFATAPVDESASSAPRRWRRRRAANAARPAETMDAFVEPNAEADPQTEALEAAAVAQITDLPLERIRDLVPEPIADPLPKEEVIERTAAACDKSFAQPIALCIHEPAPNRTKNRQRWQEVKTAQRTGTAPPPALPDAETVIEAEPATGTPEATAAVPVTERQAESKAAPIDKPGRADPVDLIVDTITEPATPKASIATTTRQANSIWRERVFNSAPNQEQTETVTWPRRRPRDHE